MFCHGKFSFSIAYISHLKGNATYLRSLDLSLIECFDGVIFTIVDRVKAANLPQSGIHLQILNTLIYKGESKHNVLFLIVFI